MTARWVLKTRLYGYLVHESSYDFHPPLLAFVLSKSVTIRENLVPTINFRVFFYKTYGSYRKG